jgi:MFS transporter, DHA1 family, inner membrane transport protein
VIVRSAIVVGLAWLGDALIYVVMPLHAAAFGIALPWVGLVLSINRLVRIVGYGWIEPLSRRVGGRNLIIAASGAAAISTLAYGLTTGIVPLLAARLLWGICWGLLNLLTTVYALGAGPHEGRNVGLNRAVSTMFPTLALSAGAWLATEIGPRQVFLVLGAVSLLGVPLAFTLPSISDHRDEEAPGASSRWRPSSLNVLFFTLGLVDGVFTVTLSLLLAGPFGVQSAMLGAGLLLAAQRLIYAVMYGVGGVFVDRFGADRILTVGVSVIVLALFGVATGSLYPAAVAIVVARSSLAPVGPVLTMRRRGGTRVERLAAFATWADSGAAAGPLFAGLVFGRVSVAALYSGLALLLALALLAHSIDRWRGRA